MINVNTKFPMQIAKWQHNEVKTPHGKRTDANHNEQSEDMRYTSNEVTVLRTPTHQNSQRNECYSVPELLLMFFTNRPYGLSSQFRRVYYCPDQAK